MLVDNLIRECSLDKSKLAGIGVGSPGVVNKESGKLLYSCNLGFRDAPLKREINNYFKVPVYIENDANCAAIAETFYGVAVGTTSSVTITIGTGIGGAIIIHKKIFSGFNFCGGELGHMIIKENGNKCACGRNGCWETYASATALIRSAKEELKLNANSIMNDMVEKDIDLLNAKIIFEAAQNKDEIANKVLNGYYRYLSLGIVNIINMLQPEIVVIGGGISEQGEYLLKPVRNLIEREVYSREFIKMGLPQTRVKAAILGNDAGIVGAAKLVQTS